MRDWLVGGGIVTSERGLLLVQNRRRDGREDWTPPGGVIDPGETLIDFVGVSNFGTAMLDVPVASSTENEALLFEAFTDRIPPLGTKVEVIFEPVPEKKDGKAAVTDKVKP